MSESTREAAVAYQTESRTKTAGEILPPLQSGDRLTRAEFERRYDAMPQIKKAELIKGVVYVPSPILIPTHAEPHAHVVLWVGTYAAATPGVRVADNGSVRIDEESEPQPDVFLWIDRPEHRQAHIDVDGFLAGAPDLVVEIAASSASYDLHDKLAVYRDNGVREYVVWRTYDRQLDWLRLGEGQYVRVEPDETGVIQSAVFPGLRLAVAALLAGDLTTVLAEVQKGVQSSEHAAFVAHLQAETDGGNGA